LDEFPYRRKIEWLEKDELLAYIRKLKLENSRLWQRVKVLRDSGISRSSDDLFTTIKTARAADLIRREKYMKMLLASCPEIILLLNQDGRIAYCSNALLKLANIDDFENINGITYKELYAMFGDEEFVKEAVQRFAKVKEGNETIAKDVLIDFSGRGEDRMYTVQASPMFDEYGRFDGVLAMFYDTTDVRNAEADESARIMLDATPLACSLWDEEGNLLDCNQEALRMYELAKKSDYLEYFYDLSPEFQPDGKRSREEAERRDNAALETGYQQFEWLHLTLSGEPLPVEVTLVRIPLNDGYRFATYSRDLRAVKANEKRIHEADERNRELEVQTRAAQVASEAKSGFLASMSHEIRTPMNAIIGMSDLMRTDNLDETQRGYFEDIKKMSKALLRIINDILDFSKIEAGKMELNETNFSLIELFGNICSMSRFMAETKELEFRCSFGSDVFRVVYGDESRVRQVIVNIINNAIKYTREGFVEFSARRLPKNGRDCIAFVVRDTGIGIKKEYFPRLFDPFAQFDGKINRGIMGTGLGLPITKDLVSLMQGEIEVESEYGAGSVFTIILPLKEGDPDKVEGAHFSSFSTFSRDVKVLVVDDNTINLKVAVAYLARHNIKADTASSGAEALRKLQDKLFDLVFMDHMMPEMDGVETTTRIRALGGDYEKMPIVALTANAVSGAREIFLNAGMNDFISKPIDPKMLNQALLKWLPPCMVQSSAKSEAAEATEVLAPDDAMRAIDVKAGLKNAVGDEVFYGELVTNFLTDHAQDCQKISEALAVGDFDSARVIAHTLKSTAALIGARKLGDIAAGIEKRLSGAFGVTDKIDCDELKDELQSVLAELKHIPRPEKAARTSGGILAPDKNMGIKLIERLAPLLKSGDTKSLDFVEEIKNVLGSSGGRAELIVTQIEDFDFPGALKTLGSIEVSLNEDEG
jgi:signal transduction histidine kinase/FixJ family two-component response regulator/HPt (histidine-containing phosphotransfer) domain-containing protein